MEKSYVFENPEVIYATKPIVEFNNAWIRLLKANAISSPKKTCRLCLHKNTKSLMHQMIIMHHKSVQVPIHKHLKSDEVLNILSGSAQLSLYKDNGTIFKQVKLSNLACFSFRVPVNYLHSLKINSEWFLFQETILGPFEPKNTIYPHFK